MAIDFTKGARYRVTVVWIFDSAQITTAGTYWGANETHAALQGIARRAWLDGIQSDDKITLYKQPGNFIGVTVKSVELIQEPNSDTATNTQES